MGRTMTLIAAFLWIASGAGSLAQETPVRPPTVEPANPPLSPEVEAILQKVQQAAKELRSYKCGVDYVLRQPLLESKTRRIGTLYYVRKDDRSMLRVSFETLQQDEEKVQPYVQQFLFDGVWLTHVDYQVKSYQKRQMADANKPTDAFDLAGRDLPILGFTGMDDLRRDFDILLVQPEPGKPTDKIAKLSLKARPGSRNGQDYRAIVFGVDKALWLPVKVEAESTEGDFYDLTFIQPQVNGPIQDAVFDLKIPKEFGKPEIIPLDSENGTRPTHVP
jgi:outer membrane lipoprotein-sorting protein